MDFFRHSFLHVWIGHKSDYSSRRSAEIRHVYNTTGCRPQYHSGPNFLIRLQMGNGRCRRSNRSRTNCNSWRFCILSLSFRNRKNDSARFSAGTCRSTQDTCTRCMQLFGTDFSRCNHGNHQQCDPHLRKPRQRFFLPKYTQIPMAVVGIVMKFFQIILSIVIGIAAGCIPIVGFNMGAKNYVRVRKLFTQLLIVESLVSITALCIVTCFPQQLIAIFGASNESTYYTEFAIKSFRIYACCRLRASTRPPIFLCREWEKRLHPQCFPCYVKSSSVLDLHYFYHAFSVFLVYCIPCLQPTF